MSVTITLLQIILALSFHPLADVVPRFEPGPCRPTVNAGERVDCGMLVVRENRRVATSPLIRIPVKIFRSRSSNPKPDPVLFMLGGPGGATRNVTGSGIPFLDDRDYIVFDQRRTNLAEPVLDCEMVENVKRRMARGLVAGPPADAEMTAAAGDCAKTLRARGIDLDGYNSRAIADDIEDLRRLLKIEKWNLYGVSYSAHPMLDVMREYPASVRSAFLDSPLSPETRYDEVAAFGLTRALDIVFDACKVTPTCARAHPNAPENMMKAIERIDASPQWLVLDSARTDSVLVRGPQLVDAFASLLYNPASAAALPALADRAVTGDIRSLRPMISENVDVGGYAWGMRLAVWCSEVMPFEDRSRIAAQHERSLGMAGSHFEVVPPEGCDAMRVKPADSIESVAVKSDIPTLIMSGEIDAYVPTPWARGMLKNIPNAFLVEIRGASHGPGFSQCGQSIAAAFFNDPSRAPSLACATRAAGIDFSPRRN